MIFFCFLAVSTIALGGIPVSEKNVVELQVKNDPTISFRIWFKVGSQNDPVGKEGLAAMTAALISDGSTENNSYEQILDKLYPLAAGYTANASVEMTVVSGRVHKDNLAEYYPLFLDAILRPACKQEDLDRIKSQMLNYLENTLRYASDEELGKVVLYNSIFDGTPYGHISSGTIEALKGITIDDVKQFYKRYFTSGNMMIGIGGGYDDALLKKLRSDLGALPADAPQEISKPHSKPIDGLQITLVEKKAQATAISMGFPIDVLRGSREWYALAIANSWLGEHRNSSSHLYQVIRERRGLNYGDYSYIENFPDGGSLQMPPQNVCRRQQIFEIWIRPVPNETRHFVLRAALREFKKLVDNGMSEEDFQLTRGFLSKYVLNYAPTTTARLGYALDDRFYGITGSHLTLFRTMMGNITREEVNAAIKKHLQYKNMKIAIITNNASALQDSLLKDAPSPITYKTPKPESVLKEDASIMIFPLAADIKRADIVPVEQLFVK
jgi:zinc protease